MRITKELGVPVYFVGKPYPMVYERALTFFPSAKPDEIVMVGDTPETDIRGANHLGMRPVLVTKTGIMQERLASSPTALEELSLTDQPHYGQIPELKAIDLVRAKKFSYQGEFHVQYSTSSLVSKLKSIT